MPPTSGGAQQASNHAVIPLRMPLRCSRTSRVSHRPVRSGEPPYTGHKLTNIERSRMSNPTVMATP